MGGDGDRPDGARALTCHQPHLLPARLAPVRLPQVTPVTQALTGASSGAQPAGERPLTAAAAAAAAQPLGLAAAQPPAQLPAVAEENSEHLGSGPSSQFTTSAVLTMHSMAGASSSAGTGRSTNTSNNPAAVAGQVGPAVGAGWPYDPVPAPVFLSRSICCLTACPVGRGRLPVAEPPSSQALDVRGQVNLPTSHLHPPPAYTPSHSTPPVPVQASPHGHAPRIPPNPLHPPPRRPNPSPPVMFATRRAPSQSSRLGS